MFRYFIFIACRALSAGLGYGLSVIGIVLGSEFGRLVALLDAAKPVSGLFDALATRARLRIVAFELLTIKALFLGVAAAIILLISNSLITMFVIASYILLWWALTSFSTIYMRKETVSQYFALGKHFRVLARAGFRRVASNRHTLTLMGTSTFAAASYSSLYLFQWSKFELLALRLIDGTILLVAFTAQLVIRGESPHRNTWIATIGAVAIAATYTYYFAGVLLSIFTLCRVGSLFACARAMLHRRDALISKNQVFLAIAYLSFGAFATDSSSLSGLLLAEFISLFWLYRYGGTNDN